MFGGFQNPGNFPILHMSFIARLLLISPSHIPLQINRAIIDFPCLSDPLSQFPWQRLGELHLLIRSQCQCATTYYVKF